MITRRDDLTSGLSKEKPMRPSHVIRATRRAASRGLTLVELVIVITIIGVLTAAISIGVLQAGKKANIGAARTACNTVRQATQMWKAVHPGEDCPTVEQLKSDRSLDTGFSLKDPWGSAYKLNCDSDEITCTSAGPDHKEGTEDDIRVPQPDTPSEK
jgi:general secretion pathway protein G